MNCSRRLFCSVALAAALIPLRAAEDKKAAKEPPRIISIFPFGVVAGVTNQVRIVGAGLTNATEATVPGSEPNVQANIKSRGRAVVPDKGDAKKLGDTQVEVELFIPSNFSTAELAIVVRTPEGDTAKQLVRVLQREALLEEKEPNPGFRKANEIKMPRTIRGSVDPASDVDVFQFNAKAGRKVRLETFSTRYGSSLDSILTVHDSRGHVLANSDDTKEGRDALIHFTPPADGVYFVSLIDAHDRGGATYGYILTVGWDE